jgi:hypothetical protein
MSCQFLGARRVVDGVIAMSQSSRLDLFSCLQSFAPYICVYEFVNCHENVLVAFYVVECVWSVLLYPMLY